MSRILVPQMMGNSLGVFALLFLLVASSGIQATSVYVSAHIPRIPLTSTALRIPSVPTQGPNMTVARDQLQASLQRITSQRLTVVVGNKTVPIGAEALRSWIQVVNDKHQPVSYLHVKDTAIAATLADLAKPFLKQPVNQVSVTHPDGSSSVIASGKNGVGVNASNQLVHPISQGLLGSRGLQLNLPLQSVPFQAVNATSIDKLLEVNVVTKEMWAYDKGQLTRSFPISAGAPATPTPIGQFQIYQKLSVQDMRGFNADGTKYFQPHVHWINYFLPGGYAVHGNYWRSQSWFGAINSSHGCVSLPDSEAEWVYQWAPIGTTVITHA